MSNTEIIEILMKRFEANKERHENIEWKDVQEKLEANPDKLNALIQMQETSGDPDVVGQDQKTEEYIFFDCSIETPQRRSTCYDGPAEEIRKKKGVFPNGNVMDMAKKMGIEVLNEEQYRKLQTLGEFDLKSSSWILTPSDIRKRGGAIFADRRYNHVFVYHNSAHSFYSSRGFRGMLRV